MARRHSSPDDPPAAPSTPLAEFFRAHHATLIRFLIRRGANEADAHDVAQKVWLSLLKPGVNFLGARFPKAYLWTAALREWARLHRRQQDEQQLVLTDSDAIEAQSEHPEHVDYEDLSVGLVRSEAMTRAYALQRAAPVTAVSSLGVVFTYLLAIPLILMIRNRPGAAATA